MRTLTALMLAGGVLLAGGCGATGLETGAGTVEKKTAVAFLTTIESDWHRRVDAEPAKNLSPDARCYYVTGADSNKSLGTVACGPLRRLGTAERQVWDVIRVGTTGGDRPGLKVPEEEAWQQSQLRPESSSLWRPDDKTAAEDADTLAAPPPPAATGGLTELVDKPGSLDLKPAEGRLVVPDGTLVLKGIATPATIGSGVDIRRPASGEKFVAAVFSTSPTIDALTGDPAVKLSSGDRPPASRWTVKVGAEHRPIEVLPGDPAATTVDRTLVVSVPENSSDVLLTANHGSTVQGLSLVTGKRTTSTAAAYYRQTTEAKLDKTLPNGTLNVGKDFESRLALTLHKAALTPWDPDRGWAPAGKAWVRVSLESELEYTWILYTKSWAKPFLTATADGAPVPPAEGDPESSVISFLVPENAKTVVISATPRLTFANKTYTEPNPRTGTATYPTLTATATFN